MDERDRVFETTRCMVTLNMIRILDFMFRSYEENQRLWNDDDLTHVYKVVKTNKNTLNSHVEIF